MCRCAIVPKGENAGLVNCANRIHHAKYFSYCVNSSAFALSVMVSFQQVKSYSMSGLELAWDQNGIFVYNS